jgi:hypothetical protein
VKQRPGWGPRAEPLAPAAVVGLGPVAARLGRRLLALGPEQRAPLEAVAGAELLVVLGPREALPWVDGVRYLGRSPEAPGALLPTSLAPDLPEALLVRALGRRCPAPFAVLVDPDRLVPLVEARRVDPDRLAAWLEGRPEAPA